MNVEKRQRGVWGGRAAVAWAEQLSQSTGFDKNIEHLNLVARVLDGIYQASG